MKYQEFAPSAWLEPYVNCFYSLESDTGVAQMDTAFATGCLEVMFNLGQGTWQIADGNNLVTTRPVEIWGQVISPFSFRLVGKYKMLGIRFFPHTASLFIQEEIRLYNNKVLDLELIFGNPISVVHTKLLETHDLKTKINILEQFLHALYCANKKRNNNLALVGHVIEELKHVDFCDNIQTVASRYGITSRYLQQLFLQYTGLTPKLYSKINRFQNSLVLVAKNELSLTSIAYECNYFDQSHFIREFKSFTGLIPSEFGANTSTALFASYNK